LKLLLQEKQRELERIQNQHRKTLDDARRAGEMEGYDRAVRDQGSPPQGYRSPPLDLQSPGMAPSAGYGQDPAHQELIEHYKNESTKTRIEVESIKTLLHDIQAQNKVRGEEQRFTSNRFDDEKLRTLSIL